MPPDHLPSEAFRERRPAYGVGSLADLLPSVCAHLGVPGTADVIGLREPLDGVDRIAVLLVDGMGAYQLPLMAPHAPVLAGLAAGGRTLTSGFPSTTPVSLVTLGTGTPPGAHGVLGFTVRTPSGAILNHIRWGDDPDPRDWQPVPSRLAVAAAAGVTVTTVTRPEFEGSGLTVSAYGRDGFRGAPDPDRLAGQMLAALSAGTGPALVYGYHPDLDRCGHEDGIDSPPWRAAAAGVDRLLDRLALGLPPGSAVLVTADHGQLNVPSGRRYDLGTDPALAAGLSAVAGEPRLRYLYPAAGARDDVLAAYREVLGADARVMTRDEAIDDGWFGPVPAGHRDRIGEVVVLCRDRAVLLASGWEPPAVGRLVAYHGSSTAAEMTIPLLLIVR
nr:nucleotide pyrophosphatase/phosphodiesterase family protein [Mangrovihabitans endophyticus]